MPASMSQQDDRSPRGLLRQGSRLHQRRSLQEANEISLELSGNQLHHSSDPHGQILRQLRQSLRLDPSKIATQACISLGQLYELETGGRHLFYSEALRHQAGRRVAQLLGSDWDAIVAGKVCVLHSAPATARPAPAGGGAQVIDLHPHTSSGSLPRQNPNASTVQAAGPTSLPPSGTALLNVPAQLEGTAQALDETTAAPRSTPAQEKQRQGWLIPLAGLTLLAVALVMALSRQ